MYFLWAPGNYALVRLTEKLNASTFTVSKDGKLLSTLYGPVHYQSSVKYDFQPVLINFEGPPQEDWIPVYVQLGCGSSCPDSLDILILDSTRDNGFGVCYGYVRLLNNGDLYNCDDDYEGPRYANTLVYTDAVYPEANSVSSTTSLA